MNSKSNKTKQVKQLIATKINDRKRGISTSMWQSENDNIDRIVIKFPRNFTDFIGLTHIQPILKTNGFHVAQVMGFMDKDKLWILLVRDRRK